MKKRSPREELLGRWAVHQNSDIAHYVEMIPHPIFIPKARCGWKDSNYSWTPVEELEKKCKTCLDIIETDHLSGIERFEEINRRRIKRAKNDQKER